MSAAAPRFGLRHTGMAGESNYKIYLEIDGTVSSFWHDIPLLAGAPVPVRNGAEAPLRPVHLVLEIPRGTTAKMEISHGDMTRGSACRNPIVQDRRGATLRELRHSRMPLDYGALPRTWEDPLIAGAGRPGRQVSPAEALAAAEALATSAAVDDASPMTRAEFDVLVDADPLMGLPGDGDPLDVMVLPTGGRAAVEEGSGAVMRVLPMGAVALIDEGEVDWKVFAIDADDAHAVAEAARGATIEDLSPGTVAEMREWFRVYKTAEGKHVNSFGLGERLIGHDAAWEVVRSTHGHWAAKFADGVMEKGVVE